MRQRGPKQHGLHELKNTFLLGSQKKEDHTSLEGHQDE